MNDINTDRIRTLERREAELTAKLKNPETSPEDRLTAFLQRKRTRDHTQTLRDLQKNPNRGITR